MHPVVIQIVHVPHDRKCPGSWREAGRPTVSDIVCSQDENCSEEQQRADVPVRMGPTYRNDQAHSCNGLQLSQRGLGMWLHEAVSFIASSNGQVGHCIR